MSTTQPSAPLQERRSHHPIEELLRRRGEMLTLYNQLVDMRPFDDKEAIADLLEEFCEVMVDYTATAHFGLYRFIEEGSERRRAVMELATRVYPTILATTQCIIEFNDRYAEHLGDGDWSLEKLEKDLSTLGLKMTDRIELEDQLIELLRAPREGSAADRRPSH